MKVFFLSITLLFITINPLFGDEDEFANSVSAKLVSNVSSVKSGETFLVGVLFEVKPDWHIYWKNPGDSGLPTDFELNLPKGFTISETHWPLPIKFISNDININYGYEDSLLLWTEVKAPEKLNTIMPLSIEGTASWVSCREICIPGESELSLKLNSVYKLKGNAKELFSSWSKKLPLENNKLKNVMEYKIDKKTAENKTQYIISIDWKSHVEDFEFFPNPEGALEIEEIAYEHDEKEGKSKIFLTTSVFKGQKLTKNVLDTLIVFNNSPENRKGIEFPIKLNL